MKTRFSTLDIKVILAELRTSGILGLRVASVYDIDNKTYLIKLAGSDVKFILLIESGNRMHLTEYDWPKNSFPSGFAMKCRKHLNGRRLSGINQLGIDRIVDLCFGYDEAAYHLIIELYDRGNIVLTDFQYTILQILRTRTDNDDVKFVVREKYPLEKARKPEPLMSKERLKDLLLTAKPKDQLKRVLNPHFVFGPALLEHCLLELGFQDGCKVGTFLSDDSDLDSLMEALSLAEFLMSDGEVLQNKGFIIQKEQSSVSLNTKEEEKKDVVTYTEFHPLYFKQHMKLPFLEFSSFNKAVDDFFSKLESQKVDVVVLAKEKMAMKKLENVRKDHQKRLEALQKLQDDDMKKAELIEMNLPLVDQAIKVLNSAIANQIDWEEIRDIVKEAQTQRDPVAMAIKELKLATNQFSILLSDPFSSTTEDEEESSDSALEDDHVKDEQKKDSLNMVVDINLAMNAFGNARQYHTKRRQASQKEEKTIQASKKALKSAERKTVETLKEVATTAVIQKARKSYWFEKFLWFVSSENYLVIGGRDQQQNELIVKRYLKQGDIYVHADLHGATSVVVKNPGGNPVPPRTLLEAGTMAICHSAAWEARVVTSAWWVHNYQVSKTAPTGEYLTTGSFMIRGKKNFLPPAQLIMGFGFIFKVDETCIINHSNERRVKEQDDELEPRPEEEDVIEIEIPEIENDDFLEVQDNLSSCDKIKIGTTSFEGDSVVDEDGVAKNKINAEEEEETKYPDTSIDLQHVAGGKFQLQSSIVTQSETMIEEQNDGATVIDLGGGELVVVGGQKGPQESKQRLSAKQRRDMKKQKRGNGDEETKEKDAPNADVPNSTYSTDKVEPKAADGTKPQPAKRGQRSKLKKMKEKYKDQDEEDKAVIMQLLGSAGKPKEPKHKKEKGKQMQHTKGQKSKQTEPSQQHIFVEESYSEIVKEGQPESVVDDTLNKDEDESISGDTDKENRSILDALTGIPVAEDIILFAIPISAPYSALQNYKFKVKVTPGSGKRGKAARTALHLFMNAKETTLREKDVLRSLKNVDISRNIPGKVKISAPNLQKAKQK